MKLIILMALAIGACIFSINIMIEHDNAQAEYIHVTATVSETIYNGGLKVGVSHDNWHSYYSEVNDIQPAGGYKLL